MELEELKNTWNLLNNKLEEDKSLKESLILEMIHTKADKSVNRLINYEIFSVVVLILLIPIMSYWYYRFGGKFIMWDIYILYTLAVCLLAACYCVFKIQELMRIDLAKKVSENMYYTNRYNIRIKREKLYLNLIVGPVFVVLAIFMAIEMKVRLDVWIFLICVFILASLGTYWSYKRIYDKNIASILKSLNEIKELEEKD